MFGKLTWAAIPFDQPIPLFAAAVVGVVIAGVLVYITLKGWLPYLWREWITSVDHKRIGIMYTLLAMVMLLRGFSDAIMMRSQQALAFHSEGYLPPDHYDQIFSAHGTLMIFFVAMPFVIGLMNFVMPLQLGVRDVAFPTLNSVSFWLTATGALLINISLVVGEFARTGWLPYPPLSELAYSPGVGVDYYLWSLQISGVGTLLTGVNFVTTILKIHAPGMTYMRMPMFCWTSLASSLLMVAAFPILTATLAMLILDRYLGFHFFTNEAGGNVMMFMNLIWAWGHPEVYILILPAFGIFSEVISTFSRKPLFGYRSMVMATLVICILSFTVWLHHFFTMGAGADVNAIFGIASMIIAVPTGVKVFNWLFTMYGGRVVYASPILWSLGFMVTFVLGGMTGVLLAVPPADFLLHNSLFLVAHFHNVIIGGVLFGAFAGYSYWFPKAFGFRLHEGLGKAAFWFWIIGFYVAFMPLYVLGLMGMTRRMQHYDVAAWHPWLLIAAFGAALILTGIVLQIVAARRQHQAARGAGRRDRRSLERALPGMGDLLPAARLQFRGAAPCRGRGCLLGHQGARPAAGAPRRGARIYGHRDAAQQRHRLHLRLLRHLHGLRADLAYLVDRGPGCRRRLCRPSSSSPGGTGSRMSFRPRRSPASTGPTEAPAARRSPAVQATPMSTFEGTADPNRIGAAMRDRQPRAEHAARGLASKRIIVGYGFWVFLLSDIIMFSAFFATYAVLVGATAGGPSGRELFELPNVAIETACLLLSSFTCGLAHIGAQRRSDLLFYGAMAATFLLGAGFIGLEIHEFAGLVARGRRADAQRLPLGLLHAGRLPRPACDRRPALAADDDGPGLRQGLPARYPAAHPLLLSVLAYPGHHLGGVVLHGLSDGSRGMSQFELQGDVDQADSVPGDEHLDGNEPAEGISGYLIGLGLATLLTVVSFFIARTTLVWQPSIPVALAVLAVGQMGVHLVFFLKITTGPDNFNNVWRSPSAC